MADDMKHSTQYYIRLINRAILGQFAMQTIETWEANSSTWNTPMAIKRFVPMQLSLFLSPPTWSQYVSDCQLENYLNEATNSS